MPVLSAPIRLIVGLGNPGEQYVRTRHNAGVWFVEKIAHREQVVLRHENKFKGLYTSFLHNNDRVHLLIPTTFMNHSGQAVRAISDFYHISSENILIAHDELDISVGDIRLKYAGGHGGHNGLKDIVSHLHTSDFYRLRIGIAHPGERHRVLDHVLSPPSREDKNQIDQSINQAIDVLDYLLNGENEKAIQTLHTQA